MTQASLNMPSPGTLQRDHQLNASCKGAAKRRRGFVYCSFVVTEPRRRSLDRSVTLRSV